MSDATSKALICKVPVRIYDSTQNDPWENWFSNEAIVTFAALYSIAIGLNPMPFSVSATSIALILFNEETPTRNQKEFIKKGLMDLYEIDGRWLEPQNDNMTKWKINTSILFEPYKNNNYIYAYFSFYELRLIYKYTKYKNKTDVMAFYIKFRSIFDYKYKCRIEHFSQDKMKTIFKMSKSSISDHLAEFVKMGLICCYEPKSVHGKDNRFYSLSNIYYLPGSYEIAEAYAEELRIKYIQKMNE